METYSFLRAFADSWMLLFLFGFFVAVILWVFRPGSSREYQETAGIPFRHDDAPAVEKEGPK
ncbi:cbb3-type cytochrome c oxidase subunit 3 [Cognatishimia sp. SS12]|uniref:cbb3-type cytochrome c oxidase subunit 3 n=1 Tax=Cognatishimia sp. SS12 TaxID=2979465 RepID=UPI00232B0FB7|nr:cbb3-type cytochrome c oxidase subunit 3 [Cognatishimia sp. SS12]MDC0739140.1 cbb3-type cytochrome c oxidase subunit 3 [Cognatishimia sp. SS12]